MVQCIQENVSISLFSFHTSELERPLHSDTHLVAVQKIFDIIGPRQAIYRSIHQVFKY